MDFFSHFRGGILEKRYPPDFMKRVEEVLLSGKFQPDPTRRCFFKDIERRKLYIFAEVECKGRIRKGRKKLVFRSLALTMQDPTHIRYDADYGWAFFIVALAQVVALGLTSVVLNGASEYKQLGEAMPYLQWGVPLGMFVVFALCFIAMYMTVRAQARKKMEQLVDLALKHELSAGMESDPGK